MLQNKIILLWETLAHFQVISKKHAFVAVSRENRLISPKLYSHAEAKGICKIYSKLTREHPSLTVISIKLLCNFIEITLRHGYSPVTLQYIFRTSFPKNTSEGLLLPM